MHSLGEEGIVAGAVEVGNRELSMCLGVVLPSKMARFT